MVSILDTISIPLPLPLLRTSAVNHVVNRLCGLPRSHRKINATSECTCQKWSLCCSPPISFTQQRSDGVIRDPSNRLQMLCLTQGHLSLGIGLGKTDINRFFRTLCCCSTTPCPPSWHTLWAAYLFLVDASIITVNVFKKIFGILLYCNELRLSLVILIIGYGSR